MKKQIIICIFISLLLFDITSLYCQSSTFTKEHLLDFNFNINQTKDITWYPRQKGSAILSIDSTLEINGKHPLHISQVGVVGNSFLLDFYMEQRLLIPETNSDSAEIKLMCRTKYLKFNYLIVDGLNQFELRVKRDTILALTNNEWKTFNKKISLRNTRFLNFAILAQGIHPRGFDQNLWLDRVEIIINGRNINSFEKPSIVPITSVSGDDIISLSFSNEKAFNKIDELNSHRIIALSESMHGSATINVAALQLIKNQVENNNCKLVLFEISLEKSLAINRFIHGDKSFSIDSLISNLNIKMSAKMLKELFEFLNNYNKSANEMVSFLGIDIEMSQKLTASNLAEYLNSINKTKHNLELTILSEKLRAKSGAISNSLNYLLNKESQFEIIIGKVDCKLLKKCLQSSLNKYPDGRLNMRDTAMYENSRFLIENFCSTRVNYKPKSTIIYSHFMHVNPISSNPRIMMPSLGTYLKSEYGEDYFVVGLLSNDGNIYIGKINNEVVVKPLQLPPSNSLEAALNKVGNPYFYYSLSNLKESLTYLRNVFVPYNSEQFFIVSPHARLNAIIFVHKSEPSTPPSSRICD